MVLVGYDVWRCRNFGYVADPTDTKLCVIPYEQKLKSAYSKRSGKTKERFTPINVCGAVYIGGTQPARFASSGLIWQLILSLSTDSTATTNHSHFKRAVTYCYDYRSHILHFYLRVRTNNNTLGDCYTLESSYIDPTNRYFPSVEAWAIQHSKSNHLFDFRLHYLSITQIIHNNTDYMRMHLDPIETQKT